MQAQALPLFSDDETFTHTHALPRWSVPKCLRARLPPRARRMAPALPFVRSARRAPAARNASTSTTLRYPALSRGGLPYLVHVAGGRILLRINIISTKRGALAPTNALALPSPPCAYATLLPARVTYRAHATRITASLHALPLLHCARMAPRAFGYGFE